VLFFIKSKNTLLGGIGKKACRAGTGATPLPTIGRFFSAAPWRGERTRRKAFDEKD
jgi:hypothetical protein